MENPLIGVYEYVVTVLVETNWYTKKGAPSDLAKGLRWSSNIRTKGREAR